MSRLKKQEMKDQLWEVDYMQTLACPSGGRSSCYDFLPLGELKDGTPYTGGEKQDTSYALVCSVFNGFLIKNLMKSLPTIHRFMLFWCILICTLPKTFSHV
jgi:hypothetical protein